MNLQKKYNPLTMAIINGIAKSLVNVESAEIIKVHPHTEPLPNSVVGILTYPDREDVRLNIGDTHIDFKNTSDLLKAVASIDKLCFQDLTYKEAKKFKSQLLADTQYVDLISTHNLYNHYLNNNIDIEKMDINEQIEFMNPFSDYQLQYSKKINTLTSNTNQMFSKEIIAKDKQTLLEGNKLGTNQKTTSSVFDKIADSSKKDDIINEILNLYRIMHDESATLSALMVNMDSLDAASLTRDLPRQFEELISNLGISKKVIGTMLDCVMTQQESNLKSVDSDTLKLLVEYINRSVDIIVNTILEIDPGYVRPDVETPLVQYNDASFTVDDLIKWAKDPNKGARYCEEQLARLPLEVKDRMIKAVESKL